MKAQDKNVVAVSYRLEVEGQIADSAGAEAPLEYIQGTGMLIPGFEAAVSGKEPGESFDFTLQPEEGYGEYNPQHCFPIPKSAFVVDGTLREDLLQVGAIIPMMNGNGQVVQGRIAEIGEDSVTMDFNHPMAGKVLHFMGEVVSVREATKKELEEGLHGEYLPHECHCKHGKGEGHCKHGEGHCHDGECGCGEGHEGDCGCGGDDCHCGEGEKCGDGCNCEK